MNRHTGARFGLLFVVAVTISSLLGAVGDGFAFRHGLTTPGILYWQLFHPAGSTPERYMSGLWTTLVIDGLCWLILLALVSGLAYAAIRPLRTRRGWPDL